MAIVVTRPGGESYTLGGKEAKPALFEPTSKQYDKESESTIGAIARNLYKPAREVGSAMLGGIPSVWNFAAGLGGKLSEYITPGGLEPTKLPQFPEEYTTAGRREQIFKPVGETLFGRGSQDPQEGFVEETTDLASEILPWALAGGGGLLRAAGTAGLQALGGTSVKALGGGEGAQAIGQLVGGLAPAAAKLTTQGISKLASGASKKLWGQTGAETAALGTLKTAPFREKVGKAIQLFEDKLPEVEKKIARGDLENVTAILAKPTAPGGKIKDLAESISTLSQNMVTDTGKKFVYDVKKALDSELDKIIKSYPQARGITTAIKSHAGISKAIENANKVIPDASGLIKKMVTLGTAGTALKFGGVLGGAATAAAVFGATTGAEILRNVKFLKANPALGKVIGSAIKDISVRNLTGAAHNIDKVTKELKRSSDLAGKQRIKINKITTKS